MDSQDSTITVFDEKEFTITEIQTHEENQPPLQSAVEAGKFLTFRLDREEYGLEATKVQEIIGVLPAVKIPGAPDYVRGMINLRGRIIPIIALRKKFNFSDCDDTERTCIVVVEALSSKGNFNLGVVVDEAAEVIDIPEKSITATPEFGTQVNTEFIVGVGVVEDKIKLLLDIDRVISADHFDYQLGVNENGS